MNHSMPQGSIVLEYPGSPEDGLLAWIDPEALKIWWQAADARIDPVNGGMYYIRWQNPDSMEEQALMGIVSEIDSVHCSLSLKRILFVHPHFRLLNLSWRVYFERAGQGQSRMVLHQQHSLQGKALAQYQEVFNDDWSAVFRGLELYLRHKCKASLA